MISSTEIRTKIVHKEGHSGEKKSSFSRMLDVGLNGETVETPSNAVVQTIQLYQTQRRQVLQQVLT